MNPQTGESEVPPFTIALDLDFTWQRKPDKWGFIGQLGIRRILNPETLAQGPWMDRFPDLALAVPLMTEITTLEVAGGLRPSHKAVSSWRLAVTDTYGERYTCDVGLNASEWPWAITVSPGSFVVAYQDVVPLLGIDDLPLASGEIDIQRLRGSGRLGEWREWDFDLQAEASLDALTLPKTGHRFEGVKVTLETRGKGSDWSGKASVMARKTEGAPLTKPLMGLSVKDLAFTLSKAGIDFKGPYSVEGILGSSWSGSLAYSPKGDYHLSGSSKKLNLSPLNAALSGTAEVAFDLHGNLYDATDPELKLDLASKSLRWGKYDLSAHPLTVQLAGKIVGGRTPRWSSADIKWGTALHVGMKNCVLEGDHLDIAGASLSGDLSALQELVPTLRISPSVQKWIHPRDCRIDGGISVTLKPSFSLRIEEGQIDTGRGIKGPIAFTYSADTSLWTFRSPTLHFDLAQLLGEYKIKPVHAEGTILLNLSLVGKIPTGGSSSDWLQSGTVNGRLDSPSGQIRSPFAQPSGQPTWFSWKELGGPFEAQINSKSRRLTGSLFAKHWVFYTIPSQYNKDYQMTMETQAKVNLTVVDTPGEPYRVQEMNVALGGANPVRIASQGIVTRTANGWIPDLQVKGGMDGADVTPVFRGVQIGGTGVFAGEIKGNKRGNWILEGDLECSGLRFEQVAAPVILQNIKGTFYLRDVHLDEILSRERWWKSKHEFPSNPDQPDSLVKAFSQSRKSPVNLRIDGARIGATRYGKLNLRTILIRETLYLNTVEGVFAEGNYPFTSTGFVFLIPGRGVGWRVLGETERVPLSLGVPGLFDKMKFEEEFVDVTFYLTRTPPGDKVQTRYLSLDFPIGRLKDIPAVGGLLFGWTPDSLNSTELIVQQIGQGEWTLLNPFQLPAATAIPKFILMDLPKGVFDRVLQSGTGFSRGVMDEVGDFLDGGN